MTRDVTELEILRQDVKERAEQKSALMAENDRLRRLLLRAIEACAEALEDDRVSRGYGSGGLSPETIAMLREVVNPA